MANPADTVLRTVLGPTLQTASVRAIGILAAFAFLGALLGWIAR